MLNLHLIPFDILALAVISLCTNLDNCGLNIRNYFTVYVVVQWNPDNSHKMCFVRMKQDVGIIHTLKSMGKHTNVRIIRMCEEARVNLSGLHCTCV